MRKMFAAAAVAAVMAVASAAQAQTYVAGAVGVDPSQGTELSGSVALGYDFGTTRAEVAYTDLRNLTSFEADGQVLSINGFYEPIAIAGITPFVTGGVGYGKVTAAGFKDQGLVYNVGAGASFELNDNWTVQADYRRYFDASEIDADVVQVGLRYQF